MSWRDVWTNVLQRLQEWRERRQARSIGDRLNLSAHIDQSWQGEANERLRRDLRDRLMRERRARQHNERRRHP